MPVALPLLVARKLLFKSPDRSIWLHRQQAWPWLLQSLIRAALYLLRTGSSPGFAQNTNTNTAFLSLYMS